MEKLKEVVCSNKQTYKVYEQSGLFPNRYQANKCRENSEWHRSDERIIRVCGGYALITEEDYRIRKAQK